MWFGGCVVVCVCVFGISVSVLFCDWWEWVVGCFMVLGAVYLGGLWVVFRVAFVV